MSVRITKKLGYGFVANPTEMDSLVHVNEDMLELKASDYFTWLQEQSLTSDEKMFLWYELSGEGNWYVYELFHTATLPSGDKVVLFIPPGHERLWSHFNNPVDLAEALWQRQGKDLLNEVKLLQEAPSPYNKLHVNIRTGKKLDEEKQEAYLALYDFYQQGVISPEADQQYAEAFGYESLREVFEAHRPYAPAVVIWLTRWLNLFSDAATEMKLQPMILQKWV